LSCLVANYALDSRVSKDSHGFKPKAALVLGDAVKRNAVHLFIKGVHDLDVGFEDDLQRTHHCTRRRSQLLRGNHAGVRKGGFVRLQALEKVRNTFVHLLAHAGSNTRSFS